MARPRGGRKGAVGSQNGSQRLRKAPQWQQKEMVLAGVRVPPSGRVFVPRPSPASFPSAEPLR